LHTLHKGRYHTDALFLIQVHIGSTVCPSLSEIVGLQVPARHITDSSICNVCSSSKNFPSARCASGANVMCTGTDVFGTKIVHAIIFYNGGLSIIRNKIIIFMRNVYIYYNCITVELTPFLFIDHTKTFQRDFLVLY
jgi:hypothetical protein